MTSGSVKFTFPSFDDIVRIKRPDGGVDIMLNGELIDTIEPVTDRPTDEEIQEHLRRYHELVDVVSRYWNDPTVSAVDAVREQRRDFGTIGPDKLDSDEQSPE